VIYNIELQKLLFIDVGSDDEYDSAEEMGLKRSAAQYAHL
jgi:hypothetical protein